MYAIKFLRGFDNEEGRIIWLERRTMKRSKKCICMAADRGGEPLPMAGLYLVLIVEKINRGLIL